MNRIYKSFITHDYKIRTTFFNGEVREFDIEAQLSGTGELKRMLAYCEFAKLNSTLKISSSRARIEFDCGVNISSDNLYYESIFIETEKIEDINIRLAATITKMRESLFMTQADLEKRTGIHQAEISKIERGLGNPSLSTINRIAAGLNHNMDISFESCVPTGIDMPSSVISYINKDTAQGSFTISDVLAFPDNVNIELIDGCIYDIGTASLIHQEISMYLSAKFYEYIRKNKGLCKVYTNFGLTFADDTQNYVIPDMGIICDKDKIKKDYVVGAPDFILEIASKNNWRNDYGVKCNLYRKKGIREYWILDPIKEYLIIHHFEKSSFPEIFHLSEVVGVRIYDNSLKIDLQEIKNIIDEYKEARD